MLQSCPEKARRHCLNPKRCGFSFVGSLPGHHSAAWGCCVQHKSLLRLFVLQKNYNTRNGWMRMTPRPLQCCPRWCLNAERKMQCCHPKILTQLKEPNVHTVAAAHACSTCLGVKILKHPPQPQASRATEFPTGQSSLSYPCILVVVWRRFKFFLRTQVGFQTLGCQMPPQCWTPSPACGHVAGTEYRSQYGPRQ